MNDHRRRFRISDSHTLVTTICAVFCASCASDLPKPSPAAHLAEFEAWHSLRIEELKQSDSWFSVVGLFWLEAGVSSFGADSSNTFVFPSTAPGQIGTFTRAGNTIEMSVNPGVGVIYDGEPVSAMTLSSPSIDGSPIVQLGSLSWFVIHRADRIGIRLKDSAAPAIEAFDGIDTYPISVDWVIPARFDRYDPPKDIRVPNIIGTVSIQPSPGAVVFQINGEEYRLDTTGSLDNKQLFIVFGDETNARTTYGGGRFLSVPTPDDRNRLLIDFNRATNPPCAFTAFATCPLPPRQNLLAVETEAGEKSYKGKGN